MAGFGRLALLGTARGAASAFGLLAVLLIARALSPEQLGHWSLALAVQGYALHLGEFGLRSVVTTEAARAGRRLPELLARYLRLRLAMTALALALVTVGCAVWRPSDLPLVALVTLSIVPIALQLDWLALVDGRIWLASGLLLARPIAFLLFVALWPGTLDPGRVAVCFLAAWLIAAMLSWAALGRAATDLPGMLPMGALMMRRGACLAGVTVGNQLQLSADLLVVGWVLGSAAAGDYWLAGQILVAGLLFANAAGQTALARLPALTHRPERFGRTLLAETRHALIVALLGVAVAIPTAPILLPLLFSAEHVGAAPVLLWLLPWFLLQHPTTVLQAGLTAVGRAKMVLRANLLAAVALLPALAVAAAAESLTAFALARAAAETVRLAVLLLALAPALAPQTSMTA